jgi:hypothetical protein
LDRNSTFWVHRLQPLFQRVRELGDIGLEHQILLVPWDLANLEVAPKQLSPSEVFIGDQSSQLLAGPKYDGVAGIRSGYIFFHCFLMLDAERLKQIKA